MKKSKKFKHIKLIFGLIVLIVCTFYLTIYIKSNNYIFLYINPDNNTKIYPYIAKATNKINNILFDAAKLVKTNNPELKVLYTNGYGSGFIKNNETSSDLDYGAGVYLGKYLYDGKNSVEISEKLLRDIALYQATIYSLVQNNEHDFYIQRLTKERILGINNDDKIYAQFMAKSLDTALKGKPYKMEVASKIFLLKPNEVVLPDYKFIKLYSKDISYGENYRKMLRELTVTVDYYFDLVDSKTNKTYPISLIASVNDGLRSYQQDLRYFVPNAFTSLASFNYVKNIMPNLDDNSYFDTRLINYYHHYTLLSYGNSKSCGNPLKIIKRLLQCTDVLAPILPKDSLEQIHKSAYAVISSPTVALLNDYYVANEILYNITKATSLYEDMEKNQEVSKHISNMEYILNDMINDPQFSYNELKPLFEYQREIFHSKNNITNLQTFMKGNFASATRYIDDLIYKKMPDNSKFNNYIIYLNKVLESAGIYNIKFYNDRDNHIYVMKDSFSKTLDLKNITKLDIKNGFYTEVYNSKTELELLPEKDFYADTRRISHGWVRYNPTELQNSIYNDMKKYMLKDRRRFHLRIRPGIQRENS